MTPNRIVNYNQNDMDETTLEVLKKVAFSAGGLSVQTIANEFKISIPKAEYYIDELRNRELVRSSMAGDEYFSTKEGRKLLFDKNLL